ncbi:hypothetical protein BN988_00345 [Oceanobacillus picturae]|uniref:Uncharacterized protein n=1 Tax=Oceanobacillus picturae TaxID=171693 RepID=W9A8R7_9BACI|nr:hypothetical protein [Oceanobacillus picturae]CDO01893.1 hypothetical protein BN988_00345 [Oceanobacillus picturae]
MNKWGFLSIIIVSISVAVSIYIINIHTLPAITYFPITEDQRFEKVQTDISLFSENGNDSYEIIWSATSVSDAPTYLRQDASLLFDNGRLRGLRSIWKQDTDSIIMKERLFHEDSSLFQAITFHHGEIHKQDKSIHSMQQITADQLYVIDSPTTALESFKKPQNNYEVEWKNLLEKTTRQQLLYHWNQLFTHFDIDSSNYLSVPLTSLATYQTKPLPSLTQQETDKIMGQLWEGLYKNYIVPATTKNNKKPTSYIPIILFSKDQDHLLVLFELNGRKNQLIQKYSLTES